LSLSLACPARPTDVTLIPAGPLVRRPKGHGDTEEASEVSLGARTRTIAPIDRVGQNGQRPRLGRRRDAVPSLSRGLRGDARVPWRATLHPRRAGHDVPRPPLDHAPVRGLRDREGGEPAIPVSPRAWQRGPECGLRLADADG